MRRIALGLAFLLATAPGCVPASTPTTVDQEHSYAAADGKLVRLDLRSLDVHVRVVDTGDIKVRVHLQARASSARAASRWVERNTPVIEDSPTALEVRTADRHATVVLFGFISTDGRVDVEMPRSCRLEIGTSSGDVQLAGPARLTEPARIHTSSGDVRIDGGAASANVRTSSGDVRVEGERLTLLDVETTSGDVRLGAGAAKVVADTTSGDLRLLELNGGVSADTTSGDVWATWQDLPSGAALHISTSSGDVVLRLPTQTSLSGELRTSSGEIRSRVDGSWDDRHHRLTLTGSGPALDVRTSSGDITIAAR